MGWDERGITGVCGDGVRGMREGEGGGGVGVGVGMPLIRGGMGGVS